MFCSDIELIRFINTLSRSVVGSQNICCVINENRYFENINYYKCSLVVPAAVTYVLRRYLKSLHIFITYYRILYTLLRRYEARSTSLPKNVQYFIVLIYRYMCFAIILYNLRNYCSQRIMDRGLMKRRKIIIASRSYRFLYKKYVTVLESRLNNYTQITRRIMEW